MLELSRSASAPASASPLRSSASAASSVTAFSPPAPCPPVECDCDACERALAAAGEPTPAHWGDDGCRCGECTALLRLALAVTRLPGALAPDEGALTNALGAGGAERVRARLADAISAPLSSADTSQRESAAPGVTVAARAAPGAIAAGNGNTGGDGSSQIFFGANGLGARPVWSAARAIRGKVPPPCVATDAFGFGDAECVTGNLAIPTRCIVGRHADHWDYFTSLVRGSRAPFALLRFVDGERMILQGQNVHTGMQAFSEDKWSWEGGESRLAADMAAALQGHYGEPYFFAFASPQDDEVGLRWYMERTEASCGQLTYANLWVNGMYTQTKAFLLDTLAQQRTRIVLAANHEGISKFPACAGVTVVPGSGSLPVFGTGTASDALFACIALPDDAVNTWQDDVKREQTLAAYVDTARTVPDGTLFITCGGPLSKPLIAAAWKAAPKHQFVDFGSTMDEILKGRKTRPYMRSDTHYSKIIDPQWFCTTETDANFVCGLFGTPEY